MNIEDTRFLCIRTDGDFKEGVYYYIIPTHIIIEEGSSDDGEYHWFCPNVNSLIKENALTRDFIQERKDSE